MSAPTSRSRTSRRAIARFDVAVDEAVMRVPRSLRPAMWFATAVGYPMIQATVLVVVALLTDGATRTAAAVLAASMLLPRVIKHLVRRRRPDSEYVAAMRMAGPSFPSGHAYSALVAAGFYAYLALTRTESPWPLVVGAAALGWVLWVSLSRVFFRAHFGSDVVGGWIIGAVVLAVVLIAVAP